MAMQWTFSGPVDSCMFKTHVHSDCLEIDLLPVLAVGLIYTRDSKIKLTVKTKAKMLLSSSDFSLFVMQTDMPVEVLLVIPYSLAKFSSRHTLAFLTPSLHNWIMSLCSWQDTCSSFHFVVFAFPSFLLVWLAGLNSAMPFSLLPFLILYTYRLKILELYGKCCKDLPALFLLPCFWGEFPRGFSGLTLWAAWTSLS